MTTLFVSPHFDDVVFSCATHLIAARQSGRVVVATAFGRGQPERQREDAEALALLGCEQLVLPFDDAPVRLGILPGFRSLLLTRYAREEEDRSALLESLRSAVAAFAAHDPLEHLVLPLGIGGHVDHRIVHSLHDAWSDDLDVSFYEDQPYAQIQGAVAARWAEVGAVTPTSSVKALSDEASLRTSAATVFAGLQPTSLELDELAHHWIASSRHVAALSEASRRRVGVLLPHALPRIASPSQEAMRCYASQLPAWFPTDEHLHRFLVASSEERLWKTASGRWSRPAPLLRVETGPCWPPVASSRGSAG